VFPYVREAGICFIRIGSAEEVKAKRHSFPTSPLSASQPLCSTNQPPADPSDPSQLRRPRTSPPRTGNSQRRTATGRGEGGSGDCGSEGAGGDAGRKGDGGEGWEGGGEVRG